MHPFAQGLVPRSGCRQLRGAHRVLCLLRQIVHAWPQRAPASTLRAPVLLLWRKWLFSNFQVTLISDTRTTDEQP
jgi:hypothetical protein